MDKIKIEEIRCTFAESYCYRQARYNVDDAEYPLFCSKHKLDGMQRNFTEKFCMNCLIKKISNSKDYCYNCHKLLYPDIILKKDIK